MKTHLAVWALVVLRIWKKTEKSFAARNNKKLLSKFTTAENPYLQSICK
jgi:hypothetical protein